MKLFVWGTPTVWLSCCAITMASASTNFGCNMIYRWQKCLKHFLEHAHKLILIIILILCLYNFTYILSKLVFDISGMLRMFKKKLIFSYMLFLFFLGIGFGFLYRQQRINFIDTSFVLWISPITMTLLLLLIFLFNLAFSLDPRTFTVSFAQVLIRSGLGFGK